MIKKYMNPVINEKNIFKNGDKRKDNFFWDIQTVHDRAFNTSQGGVFLWPTVHSLVNKYEYIECNDTYPTLVYISVETGSISCNKYLPILTVNEYK